MGTKQDKTAAREGREVDLAGAWRTLYPNVWGVMFGKAEYRGRRLGIAWRPDGSLLGTLTAIAPDDGRGVLCFGNGIDLWGVLAGLNASIAAGAWKEDGYPSNGGVRPNGSTGSAGGKLVQPTLPGMGE